MRALGVDVICTGRNWNKHAAACTVEAFLTLKEGLPSTSNFKARLRQERSLRRDQGSWVICRMEQGNKG